jgi:mannosylglycerate synthase
MVVLVSLAVFPFKNEDPALVTTNLSRAASHPRIDEVWAVASEDGPLTRQVEAGAAETTAVFSKPVLVIPQERIGAYRPGKGDAMNTAIRRAAAEGRERVHFYDADITNFNATWIDGAEDAADRGYGVVRHRFPRAATDAMITWMVTRPGFALLFPGTFLPKLNQPLGGELLLGRVALDALADSELVGARSDWGIDTVITFATSTLGVGLYEHLVPDGKRHTLYGSLEELRTMVLECLDAVARLAELDGPGPEARHGSDPPAAVPDDLKRTVAYDIDSTLPLLTDGWTDEEAALADALPKRVKDGLLANRERPEFDFMDAAAWLEALQFLLSGFRLGDKAWESLAFRLWLARVVSYTTNQAQSGYDRAIAYLGATIRDYEQLSGDI